jgi:hypothetical protein
MSGGAGNSDKDLTDGDFDWIGLNGRCDDEHHQRA